MDLTSKNMYDTFKDEIWKELGPLDPDWFNVLTAQANEASVSDQDDLCANQEEHFKTPLDKTAADSQLFSTPRVFRHSRVVSPETEDDGSNGQDTLPWRATPSPYLFRMSKEEVPDAKYGGIQPQSQDSIDLLHTPQKSTVSYAKHISESLGAQIHPDISWTSSLNTPPAVPSTLILSKTDESPCPVSVSADKSVVFVRKLFPSLSNASRVGAVSPKNNDIPSLHQDGQRPHDSPQSSLNQSEGVWRQKLPDAIEDGEIRSTVASVLDGAESVLSIFFTNSSSALRKVKTERNKRKQIMTKEHTDVSTRSDAGSSKRRTDDHKPVKCSSPSLVKTGIIVDTQWSPLSLSEIPPCTVDTTCHENNHTTQVENQQLQRDAGCSQMVRPPLIITPSGLTKKKRTFIYTVKTSKTQAQGQEIQSEMMDSSPRIPDFGHAVSVKQLGRVKDEADCCTSGGNKVQKQENGTEESQPPSIQAKVQDLDMSQLCRDFAEDFTQMLDHGKLSKAAKDHPQSGFTPSACLSAMKRAKQKAKQTNLHQDWDSSNRKCFPATETKFSNKEESDSGFQSAVADITHATITSFVLPSSENNSPSRSGFEADTGRKQSFLATNKGNGNAHFNDNLQETDANLCRAIKESQMLDPGRNSESCKETTSTQLCSSAKGSVNNNNCILFNGQVSGRLPEETSSSGFKTASNKGIHISSANLERAKRLFEEDEDERAFTDQPTTSAQDTKAEFSLSHAAENKPTSNSNKLLSSSDTFGDVICQLTASQKADVTELCTLLEEADSQFEFTQVRTAKLKHHCQDNVTSFQRADKELDPDFLTGIDFDDSFNSDAEKYLEKTAMHNKMTSSSNETRSNCESISISMSNAVQNENSSVEGMSPSNHIFEGSSSITSAEPRNLDTDTHCEISKQENKTPLMLGVAFETAGGHVLTVSKKCLNKAKALFADLETNLEDQKLPEKQSGAIAGKIEQGRITGITEDDTTKSFKNGKMDTSSSKSGFWLANGKGISVAVKDVGAFVKDCNILASDTGITEEHKNSIEPLPQNMKLRHLKNVQVIKDGLSEESLKECRNVNAGLAAYNSDFVQHDVEIHSHGFKNTADLTNAASFHENLSLSVKALSSPSYTTSKDIGSSAMDELGSGGGFCTASGKKVSVSADAVKKAECLLNEVHTLGETNKQLTPKGSALKASNLANQTTKNGQVQPGSRKRFVISSASLKKATSLLSECKALEEIATFKQTHSKKSLPGPPQGNSGFLAASGKPVALSDEVLQKANALFSDTDFNADIPAVSYTRNSDKEQDSAGKSDKMHSGFMTAGGATVHVSQRYMVKAKNLFKEFEDGSTSAIHETDCETVDSNNGMTVKYEKGVTLMSESGSEKKDLSIHKPDERVTVGISADDGTTCVEFQNKDVGPVENLENVLHLDNGEINKGVINNTPNSNNSAFLHGNPSLMAKTLFSSLSPGSSAFTEFSSGGGFCTASRKRVSVSHDAMTKAISLLNESAAFEDTNKRQKHSEDMMPPQNIGFQTASGKEVAVSSVSLKKAEVLLNEYESTNDVKPTYSKTPVLNAPPRNSGFHEACNQPVAFSSEALQKAKMPVSDTRSNDRKQENVGKTDKIHGGFITAATSVFNEFTSSGGFSTASGKKASVSDDAITESNSLLKESAAFEDTNKKRKCYEDSLPLQNCGFQTASGKGVVLSSAALKKARALLSECEGINDKIGVKPTHSKMAVVDPPPRDSEFYEASNEPVAFSSEALFSDISHRANIPAISETRSDGYKGAQISAGKIHGFTTAGGAEVHVSHKSLLKAKNLLKELADGDCHDSNSSLTIVNKNISVKAYVPSSVHGCTSINDEAPANVLRCKEGRITLSGADNWTTPREKMASVLDSKANPTNSSEGSKVEGAQESSFLILQSINLSDCTETQQQFLAQEALDCTKALLEDEGQVGQSPSMTLENVPLQDNPKSHNRSVQEQKGRGKRSVEDEDMTGQPPLKRRLLEEFDRTVGPRGSTLCPEKNGPKAIMNDRKVFKYSKSLHPNISRPHRNGTNYVETTLQKTATQHSTPENTRSAHSRMPVFVPPFHKNAKTETHKNTILKGNIRTPAFIPPFKKQPTIIKGSSSKAQEENQHHHPSVTPSTCNSYLPVTKRTQSTTDLPYNKKEDGLQMTLAALADTPDNNLMNYQNLPVGCGSEDSATKTPCVKNTSKNHGMFQNVETIELARDMQDMRIRKKKRQTIRPLPGSLFLTKTSGVSRISLKAAVNGKPPARYTQKQLYGYGVHQHVSEITCETAEGFRFSLQQFLKQDASTDCGGVQLADGGWLITSNDGTAGKKEFYRALCDTPGVDPKLISEEWVYNHYRWIVWKQASMERSFPERMGSLCLTPEQILLQLKYRYDVEVDQSRRPALRKIMERDDTAAKTLVLCVSGVVSKGQSPNKQSRNDTKPPQGADAEVESPSAVVWLTDGWYAIKAQLDEPLTAMLHKGRLAVGGKMIIHGAQLVGSQDGCFPLEAPESLMLKICANSSRPARWDTKLGFHRDPRPFLLPISSLYSNGGPVGCVDIVILRSYPIQWMERKPDGGVVFRSVRAEEKETRRHNNHKQKAMEILFAKIQAEFEKEEKGNNKAQRRKRTISRQEIGSLQNGEELYEAVGDDLSYLEAHLSEQQLETLQTYKRSLMEKKQAELQDRYRRALEAEDSEGSCLKRDVTPVWRLCVADSVDQSSTVYQLNLWRPPSDLQSLLKEGCRYKVFNLTASDGKKRSATETVQLTGTKRTQFQELQASQEWLSEHYQLRVSTSFVDLQNPEFQPLCGEVDVTGYVISIIDEQGSSPAFYVADGRLNFVKVRCFSSLSQSGLEDVVKPRVSLALSNLQLRGQSSCPTPVVYAGDLTVVSTNPKEIHLQESLKQLRNLVQGHDNFFLVAEEKLSHLVQSGGLSSISSPAMKPQTPASIADGQQDTKTRFITCTSGQPVRSFGYFTPVSKDPPLAASSIEKDPRSLKRRRALDYLSRIPSPPALSYLGTVASPCLNKTFNPPRRSGASSTLKTVQTPVCKPAGSSVEEEWVNDEELAMIDTQALRVGDVNI